MEANRMSESAQPLALDANITGHHREYKRTSGVFVTTFV
jgi:hypothetical protein